MSKAENLAASARNWHTLLLNGERKDIAALLEAGEGLAEALRGERCFALDSHKVSPKPHGCPRCEALAAWDAANKEQS
jgi:hypothetical protein